MYNSPTVSMEVFSDCTISIPVADVMLPSLVFHSDPKINMHFEDIPYNFLKVPHRTTGSLVQVSATDSHHNGCMSPVMNLQVITFPGLWINQWFYCWFVYKSLSDSINKVILLLYELLLHAFFQNWKIRLHHWQPVFLPNALNPVFTPSLPLPLHEWLLFSTKLQIRPFYPCLGSLLP